MGGVNLVDRPAGAWPGPRHPGGAQCHHRLRRPAPLGSRQTQHLLDVHGLLLAGLIDAPGRFRSGGVGISRGDQLVPMAPPAARVLGLVAELLAWLATVPPSQHAAWRIDCSSASGRWRSIWLRYIKRDACFAMAHPAAGPGRFLSLTP